MPKPEYEAEYYQDREGWPDFRLEVETVLRLARLSRESAVLEVGCGSGELLSRMGGSVRLAAGVDLSTVGLKLARRRKAAVTCALAERLPFLDCAFDAVVGQHVVEHLPDAAGALREWKRVLRPGGRVVLVTPNAAHPDPTLFEDPTHVRLFTPAELRAALEEAGFRVERLFTLFPYLGRSRLGRAASIRVARLLPLRTATGRSIVVAARA